MKQRLTALMVLSLTIASTVVGRAVYIQIIRDPRLTSLSKRQFNSKMLVTARRGLITDRNGEPLAVNADVRSLAANPNKLQNKKTVARLLAKATGIPYATLLEKFKQKKEFVWIKRHLPESTTDQFRRWGIEDDSGNLLPGLWVVKESYRKYPHGELASHLIGNVNLDNEGSEGLEMWQNSRLEGKVVAVSAVRDALGRPTLYDASAVRDARDGETVQLTLDASLQFAVEEELKASITKTRSRAGTVIVMDAIQGDILAMANYPTYNPNTRGAALDHRRNRAVTDGYEPGSTMKSVLLASALSNGWHLSDKLHGENGTFTVQGRKISEAETHEKFQSISLEHMIQVSSNVVAAKLALKVGMDKYLATLKSFGFGSRSGLGFPGEMSGVIPSSKKTWQPLTLANIGFGQGLLVTPIQMLRSYAAFLNGGWLVQPRLIKNAIPGEEAPAPKRVISEKVASQVTQALLAATTPEGTGKKAVVEGYRVAGKTGTAQAVENGRYSRSRYMSSFIGFPVGVEPRIVIFTMLDEPRGVYYASETAAPLFRDVLNAVVTRYGMPANVSMERRLAQGAPENGKKHTAVDQVATAAAHPAPPSSLEVQGHTAEGKLHWKMPALVGYTAREAMKLLQGHQFRLEMQGSGLIRSQYPEAGVQLSEGDLVKLRLNDEF